MWVRNETGEYYIGKHGGTPYSDRYIASGLAFKRAFRKYGKESFTYHVLYEGEKYHQVETNLIILFDACNDTLSYNLSHIHNDTVIHGVETRKKMSENNALKGKKVSPEVRKKIAENHTKHWVGKKFSKDHRAKISESNKNRVLSAETKMKMSLSAKGRKPPKISDETRLKMSIAAKARRERERNLHNETEFKPRLPLEEPNRRD
jgi:hypothetical protein